MFGEMRITSMNFIDNGIYMLLILRKAYLHNDEKNLIQIPNDLDLEFSRA